MSGMTLNEDLWTIGYLQSLDRLCGGHMGSSAEFQFVCVFRSKFALHVECDSTFA